MIGIDGIDPYGHLALSFLVVLLSLTGCPSLDESQPSSEEPNRIILTPVQSEMICYADVPSLPGQRFALGVPETIGSREKMMILNFPDVKGMLRWDGPDSAGVVSSVWTTEGLIRYRLQLIPGVDYVDLDMTITNLTEEDWHDVFAFNCLNPVRAPMFKDRKLERTYMSMNGRPVPLSQTTHNPGRRPTIRIYLPDHTKEGQEPPFAMATEGISPDRTDSEWLVTLSEPAGAYIAATSEDALFLFTNRDRCCLHSATHFGHIPAGTSGTTRSRLFFARGRLNDFLQRFKSE